MKNLKFNVFTLFVLTLSVMGCSDDDDVNADVIVNSGQRNLETAIQFANGFEQEDTSIFDLMSANVTDNLRMNPNGSQEPILFPDKEAVIGFITSVFQNFDNISFNDRRFIVSDDGNSVIIQAIGGDWIFVPNNRTYRQVYLFRLDFNAEGEIIAIEEYINWIVNSEITGFPIGSCQEVLCN